MISGRTISKIQPISNHEKVFHCPTFYKLIAECMFCTYSQYSVEVSGLTNNDCVLLSDMAGRTVREFTFQQSNMFNIQNLAAGCLLLKQ